MGFELGLRQWVVLISLALVALAVLSIVILLPLRALLDVSRRTEDEFTAIGEQRRTWLIAMLVATFVLGPGWLAAVAYLKTIKPRLEAASAEAQPAATPVE